MRNNNINSDIWGITVSLACAVHCSMLPLLTAYGLFSGVLEHTHLWIEYAFLLASILIATFSLFKTYNYHNNLIPLVIFGMGVLFILGGVQLHGTWELLLCTTGGLTIASAHIYNIKLNRKIAGNPV